MSSMEALSICHICNTSYALVDKTPKILSCGDTFCSSCLSSIQREGKITCVDCGEQTILPNEGVNGLPTNNSIKKMVLKLAKQKEEESSFQCASHPSKKVELFCSSPSCMKSVCVLCTIEDIHKNHDIKVTENAFEHHRKSVLSQIETAKSILFQTNKEIENMKNQLSFIENEKQTATQSVKDLFNKIRVWITKRETELLESINSCTQVISSGLLDSQQNLYTLSSTTQQSINEIESHLSKINSNNNNKNNSDTFNQLEFLKNTKKYTNNLDSSISSLEQQINKRNSINTQSKQSVSFDGFNKHTIQSFISKIGNIAMKSDQLPNLKEDSKKSQVLTRTGSNPEIKFETDKTLTKTVSKIAITDDIKEDDKKSVQPTPIPTMTKAKGVARDYNLLLPNGNQKCKRVYGPELGDGFGTLNNPRYITIIPKYWFEINNNNNNNNNSLSLSLASSSSSSQRNTPLPNTSFQKQPSQPFSTDDLLAISDSHNQRIVLIEKTSGKVKSTIGTGKKGNQLGQFNYPMGTAITFSPMNPNLILLVADYENNRLQAFDIKTGKYLDHFINEKYLKLPASIHYHHHNQIIVANYGSNTITFHTGYPHSVHNDFGTLLRVVGDNDGIKLDHPWGISFNSKSQLIISSNHKIDILDGNTFQPVKSFGSQGNKNGEFNYPDSVCVDALDNILVCDYGNHRVQIFDKNGNWIKTLGKEGVNEGSFDRPTHATANDENGDIYVVDCWNHRVMMF